MKFAINYQVQDGPWGGGNRFVDALQTRLKADGHSVSTTLSKEKVDMILMIDPRRRNPAVTFPAGEILRHLRRNPNAIVVHRINECDERKGTTDMNRRLRRANYAADHTVFVAEWLRRDIDVWHDKTVENSTVILNGADANTFHAKGQKPWSGDGPLRLVTHHWGGNWMKGFDIYQKLDAMLAEPAWRDRIALTYIGNLPPGFTFKNAQYLNPLDGDALANALRAQHVYVTGSINEPGSNHQNEGALCGLPVLYLKSGALPEYCDGYGIGFTPDTFVESLERIMRDYNTHREHVANYPHVATRSVERYVSLFDELLANREQIVANRNIYRHPLTFLANQLAI